MRMERTCFRISGATLDEAMELLPKLRNHPAFESREPTLCGLLRVATLEGLRLLKERYGR